MLPTSIHISAFLTPIHCLAWCQIARSPSHVCPCPLFFFCFGSGVSLSFSFVLSWSRCNISSQCKSKIANWYWINYSMFCVCVCVCGHVCCAVAHPSEPTKRFHTLAAITNLLLLPPPSVYVHLSFILSLHCVLFSGLECSVWTVGMWLLSWRKPAERKRCWCVRGNISSRVEHAAHWDEWEKFIILQRGLNVFYLMLTKKKFTIK